MSSGQREISIPTPPSEEELKRLVEETLYDRAVRLSARPGQQEPKHVGEEEIELLLGYLKGDVSLAAYAEVRGKPKSGTLVYSDSFRILKYLFFNMRILPKGSKAELPK